MDSGRQLNARLLLTDDKLAYIISYVLTNDDWLGIFLHLKNNSVSNRLWTLEGSIAAFDFLVKHTAHVSKWGAGGICLCNAGQWVSGESILSVCSRQL